MSATQPIVKPDVEFIVDLFQQVRTGRLRVPRFQRPFVWRPEQMRDLFDSIERGYPIGTLLVWETDHQVRSLEHMGILPVPDATGAPVSYLVDGHQRLSTLYSVLNLPANHPRSEDDDSWKWWIYRNVQTDDTRPGSARSGRTLFDHVKRGEPPMTYLPLRAVLKTTSFLSFSRRLSEELGKTLDEPQFDAIVERAEEVANRIKSYRIGIIKVVGGSLEQAVEIFARLNSKGQDMSPDQMVAALTYREGEEENEGGFSLSEHIDDIESKLAELKCGPVPRDVVFRTIVAATGHKDIQRTDWSKLARDIKDAVAGHIDTATRALQAALAFARDELNIPHTRLVPYAAQLVQLAAFFTNSSEPSEAQRRALRRWFWATSFSCWFGGANTTQLKNMLASMRAFAEGHSAEHELLGASEIALPYPERFVLQSARVRIQLLWQLQDRPPRGWDGQELQPYQEISSHGSQVWRHIVHSRRIQGTPHASDPANRILLPRPADVSLRKALTDLDPANNRTHAAILDSHFISLDAHAALRAGEYRQFIKLRSDALRTGERAFMASLKLESSPREHSIPSIDTEEF